MNAPRPAQRVLALTITVALASSLVPAASSVALAEDTAESSFGGVPTTMTSDDSPASTNNSPHAFMPDSPPANNSPHAFAPDDPPNDPGALPHGSPVTSVYQLVDGNEDEEPVELLIEPDGEPYLTRLPELCVEVADLDADLSVITATSRVRVIHTAFGETESDEPTTLSLEPDEDDATTYRCDVPLEEGENVVEVVAADEQGHAAEPWERVVILDTQAPTARIIDADSDVIPENSDGPDSDVGPTSGANKDSGANQSPGTTSDSPDSTSDNSGTAPSSPGTTSASQDPAPIDSDATSTSPDANPATLTNQPIRDNIYRARTLALELADNTGVDSYQVILCYTARGEACKKDVTDAMTDAGGGRIAGSIVCEEEGTYTQVIVHATDLCGNATPEEGLVIPLDFVVDKPPDVTDESIVVHEDEAPRGTTRDGQTYFRAPVRVTIETPNGDIDAEASVVEGYDVTWSDGVGTLWLGPGHHQRIVAHVADVAGGAQDAVTVQRDVAIVVDELIPRVDSVEVSADCISRLVVQGKEGKPSHGSQQTHPVEPVPGQPPSSESGQASDSAQDELQAYDTQTVVTLHVTDDEGLEGIELVNDPRGFDFSTDVTEGDCVATASLAISQEADAIGRDALVRITDLAGNYRIWSIDPQGVVRGGSGEEVPARNVSIRDDDIFPRALVYDAVPPTIEVVGVTDGLCTSDDQRLVVTIAEANYQWLLAVDASQEVVGVQREDKDGTLVPVKGLSRTVGDFRPKSPGDTTTYVTTIDFTEEGDYVVDARITDIAGRVAAADQLRFHIDRTRPVVSVDGFEDGECTSEVMRTATVRVRERNFDPSRTAVSCTWTSPDGSQSQVTTLDAEAWERDQATAGASTTYRQTLELSEEGTYVITYEAGDGASAGVSRGTKTLVLDRTAPQLHYRWNGGKADAEHVGSGGRRAYFQHEQILKLWVAEANWQELPRPEVVGTGRKGSLAVRATDWRREGTDRQTGLPIYACELVFEQDARYAALSLRATDKAGNAARPLELSAFTLDTTAPTVSITRADEPDATDGDVDYYRHPVTACIRTSDRNLDVTGTIVDVGTGAYASPRDRLRRVSTTDDLVETHEAQVTFGEGSHADPVIRALDKAGGIAVQDARTRFVVDLTAPTIVRAQTSAAPTSAKTGDGGERQFFNTETLLTIEVADNFRLKGGKARLEDPQGEYTRDLALSGDGSTGTVTVQLVDGTQSANDTEFDRYADSCIVLTVEDMAGNVRTWSIDRTGTVSDYAGSEARNTPLNDQPHNYPLALVLDQTPPHVTLSGVTEGTFYTSAQTVHARVDEFNFAYLKQLDPSAAVLHVSRRDNKSEAQVSNRDVPASEFEGEGSDWHLDLPLPGDGHYEVWASFEDIARNPSDEPRTGTFTIDTTAPELSVSFDNNDARNGRYFKAARHATVTVVEHNFDPALFSVTARNGIVGEWSSEGDTRTCVVAFEADGICDLAVSGKDLAGNEATPFAELPFAIDTSPPTVDIAGTGERLGVGGIIAGPLRDGEAYNGVVAPTITFADAALPEVADVTTTFADYSPADSDVTSGASVAFDSANSDFATPAPAASDFANADFAAHSSGVATQWGFTLSGGRGTHVDEAVRDGPLPYAQTIDETGAVTVAFDDFGSLGPPGDEGEAGYDVRADDVYVLSATASDLAGNETTQSVTFSVNRFGSNFLVDMLEDDAGTSVEEHTDMLPQAPHVVVREINVSGVGEGHERSVTKEYAHTTTTIPQDADGAPPTGEGYSLDVADAGHEQNGFGWSECTYDIRAANFAGQGQGLYRVNVSSVDAASNGNSTADFWGSDLARQSAASKVGTAEFVLDEQGPSIDAVDLPVGIHTGDYRATFHVTDTLTSQETPNKVQVIVDGEKVEPQPLGSGSYAFDITARPFALRSVSITASDYAGRTDAFNTGGMYVSSLVPEVTGLVCLTVAVGVTAVIMRRRRRAREPDMPTREL